MSPRHEFSCPDCSWIGNDKLDVLGTIDLYACPNCNAIWTEEKARVG